MGLRHSSTKHRATCGALLPISWAAISCTLTTDLDLVGPEPHTSKDPSDVPNPGNDASVVDTHEPMDGGTSSTPTTASESSHESSAGQVDLTQTAPVQTTFATTSENTRPDTSTLEPSLLDASTYSRDASVDGAPNVDASNCVAATTLLSEGYEGDLTQWSLVNWHESDCQQTSITTAISAERDHSVRSRIECPSDTDHLHFTSLQLGSDGEQTALTGGYAPYGIMLSFSAWLSVGYDFDAEKWLDFARFAVVCDHSTPPLAVSLNSSSRHLVITNSGDSAALSEPVVQAPTFALATWTRVDVFVNPAEGSIIVWQDDAVVGAATFESRGSSLCHLEFGAMASRRHSDLALFQDDVNLVRMGEPLTGLSSPPNFCPGE